MPSMQGPTRRWAQTAPLGEPWDSWLGVQMGRLLGVFLWLAGGVFLLGSVADLSPPLNAPVGMGLGILSALAGTLFVFGGTRASLTLLEGRVVALDRETGALVLDLGEGGGTRLKAQPHLLQTVRVGETVQVGIKGRRVLAIGSLTDLPRDGREGP